MTKWIWPFGRVTLFTMHHCVSHGLFHAADHIISTIPVVESIEMWVSPVLSSSCHWATIAAFLILPLGPFVLSHHPSSFRATEKWRIDWISVSLWEMNLLMWRAELVPYSSASSHHYCGCWAHRGTSAPLPKVKRSAKWVVNVNPFPVSFRSSSVHLSISLSLCICFLYDAASAPFLPAHTAPFYCATIVLVSSLLIRQSVILLLFVIMFYPFILSRREQAFMESYQRHRYPNPSAAGKEDRVHEKENECHSGKVWRYKWSSCQSPLVQNKLSRPSAQRGSRPDNSLLTWRTFTSRWVLQARARLESFPNKILLF